MKKNGLFLVSTLIMFALVGCHKPAASSEESKGGDTSTEDSSEVAPSSSESQGISGVGAEMLVNGTRAISLTQQAEPDTGRRATYSGSGLSFTVGDKVKMYVDGVAVAVWAEADPDHDTYPNYDETPRSEQYDEVTIHETTNDAYVYFHQNNDEVGSYSLWITPTHSGQGGGGGGETGDTYYVRGTAVDGWESTTYPSDATPSGGNYVTFASVALAVGNFKVATADWKNSFGWWGYEFNSAWVANYAANAPLGTAAANFAAVDGSNDIACNVAGTYNIVITSDYQLYINLVA